MSGHGKEKRRQFQRIDDMAQILQRYVKEKKLTKAKNLTTE